MSDFVIRFGSVVVDDAAAMTSKLLHNDFFLQPSSELDIEIIFEATAQAGVRALVSAGWVHYSCLFT